MGSSGRRSGHAWVCLREAWKGAFGVGTLGWAVYGTVATTAFGHSPGRDGDAAFVCAAALGACLGLGAAYGLSSAGGASGPRQTRT